jgi:hypothetical protein
MHSATKVQIDTTHGVLEATQVLADADDTPMAIVVFDQVLDFLGISDWEYDLAAITVEAFRQENGMYYYSRRIEDVNGDEAIAAAAEAGLTTILLEGY